MQEPIIHPGISREFFELTQGLRRIREHNEKWYQDRFPTDESEPNEQADAAKDSQKVIIQHHGGASYSLNGQPPVEVTREEDNILKAFLAQRKSIGSASLSEVVGNPSRVMRRLAEKFPGAVSMPLAKGNGYFVAVE